MQVQCVPMEYGDVRQFSPTYLALRPPFDASAPSSAVHPFMNLRNKYYVREQSVFIARVQPPVKKAINPELLGAVGMSSSNRLPDEALRQYAFGAQIANLRNTFYQTAKQ